MTQPQALQASTSLANAHHMAALEAATLAAERRQAAADNLRQSTTRASWYDHLPKVEAAMVESDRIYKLRTAAGWELDDAGWHAPHPETGELIPAGQWGEFCLPCPEEAA